MHTEFVLFKKKKKDNLEQYKSFYLHLTINLKATSLAYYLHLRMQTTNCQIYQECFPHRVLKKGKRLNTLWASSPWEGLSQTPSHCTKAALM